MNKVNNSTKLIRVKKYHNVTQAKIEKMLKIIFPKENFVFERESPNSFYYTLLDDNCNLIISNTYINRVIVHPDVKCYSHVELTIDIKDQKYIMVIPHGIEVLIFSHNKKDKLSIDSSTIREKTELNFLSNISK